MSSVERGQRVKQRWLATGSCVLLLLVGGLATESGRAGPRADAVTLSVQPAAASADPARNVRLFGSVENGRAGEVVDIHAKDCGQRTFRGVAGTMTSDGGSYELDYHPGISTTLRAVWKDSTSGPITVRQPPYVFFTRLARKGQVFRVGVSAKWTLWKKRILIQQRRSGAWRTIRPVVLTESGGSGGYVGYYTNVKVSVPKGTALRATLPRSQARPCYLPGTSAIRRA